MKIRDRQLKVLAKCDEANKHLEKKDWRVRYYNKKGNEISNYLIKDRTEHEAENEAMADMPRNCDDWTMMAVIDL